MFCIFSQFYHKVAYSIFNITNKSSSIICDIENDPYIYRFIPAISTEIDDALQELEYRERTLDDLCSILHQNKKFLKLVNITDILNYLYACSCVFEHNCSHDFQNENCHCECHLLSSNFYWKSYDEIMYLIGRCKYTQDDDLIDAIGIEDTLLRNLKKC